MKTQAYRPGDRLYWVNTFGQHFYGTIVRIHNGLLIIKRDEWYGSDVIDLDSETIIRSRHFPAKSKD